MPKRRTAPRRAPAKTQHYEVSGSIDAAPITPGTKISVNLVQFGFIAAGIAVVVGGYLYMENGQASLTKAQDAFGKDIAEIKTTVGSTSKEQDTKREQMGKDFLASTSKIADQVAELNKQMAVQQTQTKLMTDTLTTISNQIGSFARAVKR